jgi:Rieske 2Fe-2S family protein
MDGVEGFDPSCTGLAPVRLSTLGGLLLVDIGGEAPDPAEHVGDLLTYLERYRTETLRSGGRVDYVVAANWKGIAENYNECLHCPGVHPELNALSNYMSGDEITGEGAWCGGSMTLTGDGAATMGSEGGHATNRQPIEGLGGEELKSILYFSLFPNALVSFHPDYLMLHTLFPKAADRTDVVCEWFFEPRAIEAPDFDPADAIEFWDMTNRQDWHVCELAQLGAGSRGYTAGRYSLEETDTHAFDRMVAERYMEALQREAVSA